MDAKLAHTVIGQSLLCDFQDALTTLVGLVNDDV